LLPLPLLPSASGIAGEKACDGVVEANWNIPDAKFTSQKVTRKFAGIRKESDL
jgi:hypothetical protein